LRAEYDYGVEDDMVGMLAELGVQLLDQEELERRVAEHLTELGAQMGRFPPIEWDYEITCAEIVGRIEGRIASYLWNVPDEGLKKLVDRLKARLDARVGPPSTVIRFRRGFRLLCARFPE
jgi:hypothetical protein